jgi:hypothetical protein
MFGKIRKLYDDSKYLAGSNLKKESDLLYYQAKRRMMLGLKGAIAVGENFVGKIRDDGRADLIDIQTSGYFSASCRMQNDALGVFHYTIPKVFNLTPPAPLGSPPIKKYYQVFIESNNTSTTEINGWDGYTYVKGTLGGIGHVGTHYAYGEQVLITDGRITVKYDVYNNSPSFIKTYNFTTTTNQTPVITQERQRPASSGGDYVVAIHETFSIVLSGEGASGSLVQTSYFVPDSNAVISTSQTDNRVYLSPEEIAQSEIALATAEMNIKIAENDAEIAEYNNRLAIYNSELAEYNAALAAFNASLDIATIQTNLGQHLYSSNAELLSTVKANYIYPDNVTPLTTTSDYPNHLIRHREWLNTQTDSIYADLDNGIIPKNMAIAVMNGAPYSLCVGIGSRWDGYRVTQTSVRVGGFSVGYVLTYTRKLFALKDDGTEVELLSGECAVEFVISVTGFKGYEYTFDNFVALRHIGITSYLNGAHNLTYPESLSINPSDCNGEPYSVVAINGTYNTLTSGVTDAQAQTYATSKKTSVPFPEATDITFTDIDLTPLADNDENIPKDTLRYDVDTDKDGVIEFSEKSATSTKFWIGKGLSKGESITLFPIEYIAQDGECGMFPQSYDVARLIAIRIYAGYKFNYDGDGGFEFILSFNTPTLDADGNEIAPYTEHPYVATALLGGSNVIVIAKGTSFDDVLETRKKQNSSKPEDATVSIVGQYDKDIDDGKITLKGLYDWCKQQL